MDERYHTGMHTLALYVTVVPGGRWEVRSSRHGERPYAYATRDLAVASARDIAHGQWEAMGFPCVVYVRDSEEGPWVIDAFFGSRDPDY